MAEKISSRITTLDFSIMGLLMQNPMSGYAIRMMFEKTALASYSSSPGTIYPALKRLEKFGMIRKAKVEEQRQGLYEITNNGVSALTKWVVKPVTRNDIIRDMDVLMLRFAFMDVLVKRTEKKKFLISFLAELKEYIMQLEDFRTENESTMLLSGRQAFEHGLESNKLTARWIEKILSKL